LIMWPGLAAGGIGSHIDTGWSGAGWACCRELAKGDFNGDGYNDIISVDQSGKLRSWNGSAAGPISGSTLLEAPGAGWANTTALTGYGYRGTRVSGLFKLSGNTLTLSPGNAAGGIDWSDPIVYGPRA
jgi:hypothetical protein